MPRRRYGAGRSSSSGFFLSSGKIRETQELPPGGVCNHPHMAARVLVVDDHPSFRRLASKLLAAGGFEVVGEAADGRAALVEEAR